jgi:hypothetical protein
VAASVPGFEDQAAWDPWFVRRSLARRFVTDRGLQHWIIVPGTSQEASREDNVADGLHILPDPPDFLKFSLTLLPVVR